MKSKIIIIGGGSASGKTFLANKIQTILGDQVSVINLDNFYRNNTHLSFEERVKVNYDHPSSIEDELIFAKLQELLNGHDIEIPIYDFSNHLRSNETKTVKNNKYIIIDGIFALYYPNLLSLADLKIYMDAKEEIRLERRVKRDVNERGRSEESVRKQFKETVGPMHDLFIEKTKENADIVFVNNENNGLDMTVVNNIINKILSL